MNPSANDVISQRVTPKLSFMLYKITHAFIRDLFMNLISLQQHIPNQDKIKVFAFSFSLTLALIMIKFDGKVFFVMFFVKRVASFDEVNRRIVITSRFHMLNDVLV